MMITLWGKYGRGLLAALTVGLLAGDAGPVLAEDAPAGEASIFEIGSINQTKSTGWVMVDNGWVRNVDLVKVKFRQNGTGDVPVPELTAYLFNKDGKLLRKLRGIPRVQSREDTGNTSSKVSSGYQDLPDKLEPRKAYELYYPMPPSLNAGDLRIKTFVMEIKDGDKKVRRAYPASQTDLSKMDFDGKSVTGIAETDAAPAAGGAAATAKTTEVKFRTITRFRNTRNADVNNTWVEGLQTIRAKFDLVSGADRDKLFARAYFYDEKGKQLYDLRQPPQVEVAPREYVSIPPIFKDGESYEFLFPIWDEKSSQLTDKVVTTIVVFGNKEAVAAGIYPSTRKLEEFDFPEKELALKK